MTDLKPEDLARLQRIAERATGMHGADQEHIIDVANEFSDAFGVETVLSLLTDRARMEKALRRLLAIAEIMPRRTPAPGGCSTAHTFELEAGTVWENDSACKEARQALGASQ